VDISPQRPAAWPRTTDPSAVERLVSLGASIVAEYRLGDHGWTVTHDPEGNEFCVSDRSFVI
jgi:hypothetical protein